MGRRVGDMAGDADMEVLVTLSNASVYGALTLAVDVELYLYVAVAMANELRRGCPDLSCCRPWVSMWSHTWV